MQSMKSPSILLVLAVFIALATTLLATPYGDNNEDAAMDALPENDQTPISLRGTSRFLAQKQRRGILTCNKYPRVCRVVGSAGPDCCGKKCVNVMTDKNNCGMCGKKCKYSEICCKGQCVNRLSNKRHCGGCNNKCKKGSSCVYGMCSYA